MSDTLVDPVRVGVIGLGWWGRTLATAAESAGIEVRSCFARSRQARDSFAATYDCRTASSVAELLVDDELDGLVLATPHSTHLDLIERSAGAGKHVFVEKPLALTVAEGRRAVEACESAGVVLQVGHNRRRQPANRRLRELIDTGALGTLHFLEAQLSNQMNLPAKAGWRASRAETPAGGMTALGVHMADTLNMLAGRPVRIAAFSRQVLAHTDVDDVTTAVLEYDGGALATLTTSMVIPTVARVAVFGTAMSAWNEDDGTRFYRQAAGEAERTPEPVETIDTIRDELLEFAGSVRGVTTPETDGRSALEVVVVLEGLIRSAEQGRVVDLDEVRDG